jgi:hypothetical protein
MSLALLVLGLTWRRIGIVRGCHDQWRSDKGSIEVHHQSVHTVEEAGMALAKGIPPTGMLP